MPDIPCHEHIRPFCDRGCDGSFPGSGEDGEPGDFRLHIPEYFQAPQIQSMLYIDAAFLQRHGPFKLADPADPFRLPVLFHCDIQHFGIADVQELFRKLRHAEHIVIRVHCIIRNIILDQFHNSPAYKIFIRHFFQRGEDQRMVRNEHIRPRLNRAVDDSVRRIQRDIYSLNFFFRPPGEQAHVVKIQSSLPRISSLYHLYDLFTQHNTPALSLLF